MFEAEARSRSESVEQRINAIYVEIFVMLVVLDIERPGQAEGHEYNK